MALNEQPCFDDYNDDEGDKITSNDNGEALVTRRTRNNIIIDSGSCEDVVTQEMVVVCYETTTEEAKEIRSGGMEIEVLATEELFKCLPTPFRNLKNLTLKTGLDKSELPGIACLLRSSPNLESLSITIGFTRCANSFVDPEDYWESQRSPFDCLLYHLKFLTIRGFTGSENEMSLLRYLLANSTILKKLIIKVHDDILSRLEFMLIQNVLACDGASRIAEIMIY
ncbi:putative F-box/FBD/LRR-repeat protein At4g03220 [Tasmannia lanceolata]|uniref:putative F-box/FBD/LRR-repeat protein At4g03220 n=1 Tax=Tasmannia lanceolata TaxID=3420 RepID=UPI0040637CDF